MSNDLTLWDLEETLVALLESEATVTPEQEAEYRVDLAQTLKSTIEKRDRVAAFLRFCDAQIDAAKAEQDRLAKRSSAYQRTADRVKAMVLQVMKDLDVKKLEGNLATFSRRANPDSVLIADESEIPLQYKVEKPAVWVVDKAAIKKALKAGAAVPGADLSIGAERLEVK